MAEEHRHRAFFLPDVELASLYEGKQEDVVVGRRSCRSSSMRCLEPQECLLHAGVDVPRIDGWSGPPYEGIGGRRGWARETIRDGRHGLEKAECIVCEGRL